MDKRKGKLLMEVIPWEIDTIDARDIETVSAVLVLEEGELTLQKIKNVSEILGHGMSEASIKSAITALEESGKVTSITNAEGQKIYMLK